MNISRLPKILMICAFFSMLLLITSCDQTIIDIHTEVHADYSGTRTIEVAVKTEYLQRGEVVLTGEKTLYEEIVAALPDGDIATRQDENYTYFRSTAAFDDINFLQHVSIDNFSEQPPPRFYAKMVRDDYFFHNDFYYDDYIDLLVDESLLAASERDSALNRLDALLAADPELLVVTYAVKLPFHILESNADEIVNNQTAIWNLGYGDERRIRAEGRRTKFLPYFLLAVLGFIILFILFLVFALSFSSRRSRKTRDPQKPIYSYDNYFKKGQYKDYDD